MRQRAKILCRDINAQGLQPGSVASNPAPHGKCHDTVRTDPANGTPESSRKTPRSGPDTFTQAVLHAQLLGGGPGSAH